MRARRAARRAAAVAAAGFALVTLAFSISALSHGGGVPTSALPRRPSAGRGDIQRPIPSLSAAIGLSAHVALRLVPAVQLALPLRTDAAAAPLAAPPAASFAEPRSARAARCLPGVSARVGARAAATAQSPPLTSNRSVALARPMFQAAPLEIGLPAPRRKYAHAPWSRGPSSSLPAPSPQPRLGVRTQP